jgi:hypothetical protein
MDISIAIAMGNSFKGLNIFKKIGVSLFVLMIIIYLTLSLKFIFS